MLYSRGVIILAVLGLIAFSLPAQAQECVLGIEVFSPRDWQNFNANDNITLSYRVYNALNGSEITSYAKTELLDGSPLSANPFNVATEGVHYLSVSVNATGCIPKNATIGFYVALTQRPITVPEVNLLVVVLVAALAFLASNRRGRQY
jgi:hypothetical protein